MDRFLSKIKSRFLKIEKPPLEVDEEHSREPFCWCCWSQASQQGHARPLAGGSAATQRPFSIDSRIHTPVCKIESGSLETMEYEALEALCTMECSGVFILYRPVDIVYVGTLSLEIAPEYSSTDLQKRMCRYVVSFQNEKQRRISIYL